MALQHGLYEIKVCSFWPRSERCQGISVAAHGRDGGLGERISGLSYWNWMSLLLSIFVVPLSDINFML
jgi:hypothetical protein